MVSLYVFLNRIFGFNFSKRPLDLHWYKHWPYYVIVGCLIALNFFGGYYLGALAQNEKTKKTRPDPMTNNWQIFSDEVVSFKYPVNWKMREPIINNQGSYYYFYTPEQYTVLELMIINDKDETTGESIEPSDYFHFTDSETLFDIKRSENDVDGHQSIRYVGNINGIQGWPVDTVVTAVPEKNKVILMSYHVELKGGEAEKDIQTIFTPLISTIKVY